MTFAFKNVVTHCRQAESQFQYSNFGGKTALFHFSTPNQKQIRLLIVMDQVSEKWVFDICSVANVVAFFLNYTQSQNLI